VTEALWLVSATLALVPPKRGAILAGIRCLDLRDEFLHIRFRDFSELSAGEELGAAIKRFFGDSALVSGRSQREDSARQSAGLRRYCGSFDLACHF
jgi:hypothetical protein